MTTPRRTSPHRVIGPPPRRLEVRVSLVTRLIAEQFPQWAPLPIRPVARSGWDNRTFRLGGELVVRMPSAAEYALAVEKEQTWLPRLAGLLPLPIPRVVAQGRPGAGYPFTWSVYQWLPGHPAAPERVSDPVGFATDLAHFLSALHRIQAHEGPGPGVHNWFRGGPVATYDEQVQRALGQLSEEVDVPLATKLWRRCMAAPWEGQPKWFHGDVAEGNLLLTEGRLSAVIDFGTCGVGDPACDLAIAWTSMTPAGRHAFRETLQVDPCMWRRGMGWALWKALVQCASTRGQLGADALNVRRVVTDLLREPGWQ